MLHNRIPTIGLKRSICAAWAKGCCVFFKPGCLATVQRPQKHQTDCSCQTARQSQSQLRDHARIANAVVRYGAGCFGFRLA